MVNYHGALVCGDADVEFEECCLNSCRCSSFAGEREEQVALFLQELEEVVGSKGRAEAFRFAWENDNVIECSLVVLEERQLIGFW